MTVALRFDQVSKQYRRVGYRSLRHEMSARRSGMAHTQAALSDISFDVEEGEAFAVIGPNGAGKSTALRLAARITAPSSGTISTRGRVGALIEVGAGIHPELTGRENIWLYGAILGLKRNEIAARFDDIVAFAELEDVLDRMVKHYSSGMQLRLGFSIAAGVQPDVLVVDEALAVGDARFQLRCIERMSQLVHSGTTLIYVSHDLASVATVCERAALLIGGRLHHLGSTGETIGEYVKWLHSGAAALSGASICGANGVPRDIYRSGESMIVRAPLPARREGPVTIALGIRDGHPWNLIATSFTVPMGCSADAVQCHIRSLPLSSGTYQVLVSIDDNSGAWSQLGAFRIENDADEPRPLWQPAVAFDHEWHL